MASTINTNVASVQVITAETASALATAVNTAITAINTAGTSAVTDIKFEVERTPGYGVVYTALLVINGITTG